MKAPTNLTELRAVLGLIGYYRKFIQDYGHIAEPLHKLLKTSNKFKFTPNCEKALKALKGKLTSAPIFH